LIADIRSDVMSADKPGKEGIYTVILNVTGPGGTSRMEKVWDVHVRGSSGKM
jgi:hypothetical protein